MAFFTVPFSCECQRVVRVLVGACGKATTIMERPISSPETWLTLSPHALSWTLDEWGCSVGSSEAYWGGWAPRTILLAEGLRTGSELVFWV